MKPNRDEKGDTVDICLKCIHVDVDAGASPCTPKECEISAILSGTFQYLEGIEI